MIKCDVDFQVVLMADDDRDDCVLVEEAFKENRMQGNFRCVEDGEILLDYLYRRGPFIEAGTSPLPRLILLDLNMPRKNGYEVLRTLKADPALRAIPVVVLSTSDEPADVKMSYELGANSFITKPGNFEDLVRIVGTLGKYWFRTVELPCNSQN